MTIEIIRKYWQEKPLNSIIIIALTLRLVAAIFSQGYGMHDDHFLVIEASQSWTDGTDYNNWLPKSQKEINPNVTPVPSGHSLFYAGLHYVFFNCMKFLNIGDPKIKMLLIRLIHAIFSLIVVVLGFKITLRLTNEKNARQVGLLLAALWFMPFLSVRNLVEVACIPFLFVGCWYLLVAESKKHVFRYFLLAGLITGLAFSIRFQSSFFILGMGLALLLNKKFKGFIFFSIGVIVSILAIQGLVDIIIWGRPFAELIGYILDNIQHRYEYGANQLEMYFLLLAGLLIPPIGLFLFFGFFRTWRKYVILFLPVALFLAFHLYFPNKQERFILPIFPFYIILGVIGWNDWLEKSKFWQRNQGFLRGCWIFFGIINLILLSLFTVTYSKKSRIEAMYYFYKKDAGNQLLAEDSNRGAVFMFPNFYSGQWRMIYQLSQPEKCDSNQFSKVKDDARYYKTLYDKKYFLYHPEKSPKYVLFVGNTRLEERVADLKAVFPRMALEKVAEPGFMDKVLYKLNPVNKNETVFIYRTN